jgi:mRNA interferase HigB
MKVANVEAIFRFGRKHRESANWLADWLHIVEAATWTSLMDVRKTYPSADGVKVPSGAIVTVFNVKGNEYRLLSFADYLDQTMTVIEVLTHAQYSKKRPYWKDRL